ncbi:efflux transporter outer membrane subunit [Brevundimonas sp.]|uniref:efflux transporter outer membrane subunit n=1 Tax=Brevundimonas sp. TaxID=1871086 RepID=UPI0025BA89CB|nr:efflux transporter outer membrane subunit [Brevundimonas sp.]
MSWSMSRGARLSVIGVLAVGGLAGCAVGPNFQRPVLTDEGDWSHSSGAVADMARTMDASATVPDQWWSLFGSAQLDALVTEALRANPDLKAADATLRQARAQLRAARGAYLPSVDASYQADRHKDSATLSPPLNDESLLYTLHTAQVSVSYPLDLFGGVRRSVESAAAQTQAVRYEYEAARLSIITNTILAAIEEATLREQLTSLEVSVGAEHQVLTLLERRETLGEVGREEVLTQRAALSSSEQELAETRKSHSQQQAALAILLGRPPHQPLPPLLALGDLNLPKALPLSLPSQLVRQRPDVLAAEAQLHAASAEVGVAIAARLPELTLTASSGDIATRYGDMFTSGTGLWSLGAGVTQPLFRGGALRQQQKVAEAGLDKAKAEYRSAVLVALQDVANTLSALRFDADSLTAAETAEQAARQRLTFAQRRLELGDIGTFELVDAQRTHNEAQSAAISARSARYADVVALFQALGGGWEGRMP